METPADQSPTRELSDYEIEAIRREEGLKPAFAVAEDFNTESWRVRAVWGRNDDD